MQVVGELVRGPNRRLPLSRIRRLTLSSTLGFYLCSILGFYLCLCLRRNGSLGGRLSRCRRSCWRRCFVGNRGILLDHTGFRPVVAVVQRRFGLGASTCCWVP